MNNSKSRQKIEKISKILLGASILAIVFGLYMLSENVIQLIEALGEGSSRIEYGENITLIAQGLALVIHYFFVSKFFYTIIKEGVPLTHEAAKEMRVIGWETLLIPFAITLISMFAFGGTKALTEIVEIEIYELVLGVFLLETGHIIDYATDKIIEGHKHHVLCNFLKSKYPDIYSELEDLTEKELREHPIVE